MPMTMVTAGVGVLAGGLKMGTAALVPQGLDEQYEIEILAGRRPARSGILDAILTGILQGRMPTATPRLAETTPVFRWVVATGIFDQAENS